MRSASTHDGRRGAAGGPRAAADRRIAPQVTREVPLAGDQTRETLAGLDIDGATADDLERRGLIGTAGRSPPRQPNGTDLGDADQPGHARR